LLTQALAIDPSYAPAAAAIGWCRVFQLLAGSQVTASEVAESVRLATQITETGKDQPDALWMALLRCLFSLERMRRRRA
jgi:hypothetical protein